MIQKCLCCDKWRVIYGRGLCRWCFNRHKDSYPLPENLARFGRRSGVANHHHREPAAPTDAEPGSEEKIRVMEARCREGVSLFHRRDERISGHVPTVLHRARDVRRVRRRVCDNEANALLEG